MTRREFNALGAGAVLTALGGGLANAAGEPPDRWRYLDNGTLRLGVDVQSGACIGHLSRSAKPGANYLDHYDRGRFVQQSYYGDRDGSKWDKKPWMWNPVQGGDWRGKPARVLSLKAEDATLSSRSVAMHWATGEEIADVQLEQTIALRGPVAHIHFKMTYTGTKAHAARHQEMPAVFVNRAYPNLAVYSGDRPWTGDSLDIRQPGWPNESRKLSEPWAGYFNAEGDGVGALVPTADRLTCYRFGDGTHPSHCSYFAPIKTLAITPPLLIEYDVYLSIGSIKQLRDRFEAIAKN